MGEKKDKGNMTALIGAAFLMATSAIGPGFLTQTATFTGQFKSAFALVIVATILLDVTTQLNIWSVIGVSGMRGQDIANKVVPGLGYFIACLVALGGLVFNIGNVGGGATGLNVMFGLPVKAGCIISGAIGILIFLSKDAKEGMDKLTKYLGTMMILVVLYVVFKSKPPVGEAASVNHAARRKLRRLHCLLRSPQTSGRRLQGREGSPEGAPVRAHGRRRIRNHENSAVPGSSRRSHSHA